MKQIIETMMARMQAWHEVRARRIEARRVKLLDHEARQRLQLMEHNGTTYLSMDGMPLLEASDLTNGLTESLARVRANYADFREEGIWAKR
ncbi:MAG: hypothetical protein HXO19_08360 [Prevotella shahii]|jgi:hypothetical protein|uniref:hypothetical protein n=1 Tax=Hoylesella shahii TaxID=228603 RepID=UPI001CB14865|nr:hypothetical protein [Hoylesella shahii]MBF1591094.1 hypothetical protein [Hoylesella shahii]DAU84489.1 MAG TPA: hypothetical protein [Caudoviricetes sp.]